MVNKHRPIVARRVQKVAVEVFAFDATGAGAAARVSFGLGLRTQLVQTVLGRGQYLPVVVRVAIRADRQLVDQRLQTLTPNFQVRVESSTWLVR